MVEAAAPHWARDAQRRAGAASEPTERRRQKLETYTSSYLVHLCTHFLSSWTSTFCEDRFLVVNTQFRLFVGQSRVLSGILN